MSSTVQRGQLQLNTQPHTHILNDVVIKGTAVTTTLTQLQPHNIAATMLEEDTRREPPSSYEVLFRQPQPAILDKDVIGEQFDDHADHSVFDS